MKFTSYEGKEPYIFVSYSHRDWNIVTKIIEVLHEKGYRIWYDPDIMPGDDPFEKIANHIYDSALVIVFLSSTCIQSHYCKSEVNFALSKSKNLICIVLEEFQMPMGWEMQLQNTQLLFYHKLAEDVFYERLLASDNIKKVQKREGNGREQCICPKVFDRREADALSVNDGIVVIPDDVTEIGVGAFQGRADIRRVYMGKSVKKIAEFAFAQCSILQKLVLSKGVEEIGQRAFAGSPIREIESFSPKFEWVDDKFLVQDKTMLIAAFLRQEKTCILPHSLRYLEPYALDEIHAVEALNLPEGVLYVASRAVNQCHNLKKIMLPDSVKYMAKDAFPQQRGVLFCGRRNSYGEKYCVVHGFRFASEEEVAKA